MFEKLIEQLILSYLGEYIEDLDKDKLQIGVRIQKIIRKSFKAIFR